MDLADSGSNEAGNRIGLVPLRWVWQKAILRPNSIVDGAN
jgi:hypothetical protein